MVSMPESDTIYESDQRRIERTLDYFEQGYNCAEALMMAFGAPYGLSRDVSARLAGGFGFNQGREPEKTCGVVSVALMILGLHFGPGIGKDPYQKDACSVAVEEFIDTFTARRKSVLCRQIHKSNAGLDRIRGLTGKYAFCAGVTRDAAELLIKALKE